MINKLMNLALTHRAMTILIFLGISIGGVISIRNLSIDAFPDLSPNLVQVFAEVNATPAEQIEKMVTYPVETAMQGIPGVKRVRSVTTFGLSRVSIYFEDGVDIYKARQLVAEKIIEAQENIPTGLDMPHGVEMGAVVSGTGAMFHYKVMGDGKQTLTELRTIQDDIIKPALRSVNGVAKVVSQGGYVEEFRIKLNPYQMSGYGVTLDQIIEAIDKSSKDVGAGVIEKGQEEWIVRSIGSIEKIEDIQNITISLIPQIIPAKIDSVNPDNSTEQETILKPVFIKDVATIERMGGFRRGIASKDGKEEIVTGWVYKLHKANSFKAIANIHDRIESINKTLPKGVKIVPLYDQGKLVRNSIYTISQTLVLGLIFVGFVSLIFLGEVRNSVIVVLSLPFTLLFSFCVFKLFGISGDLLSLGGLSIGLGMIVDAAIIVTEKLYVRVNTEEDGKSKIQRIREGCYEVGRPIFYAVATIIFVFLPILTLQNIEGKMFRPLAISVCIAMGGSLIYALFIAPVLYTLFPHKVKKKKIYLQDTYKRFLLRLMKLRGTVLTVVIILMGLGAFLFTKQGRIFAPQLQEGSIELLAYFDPNISLAEIGKVSSRIEKDVKAINEVAHVTSDIGYGEVGPHVHQTNFSSIHISLKPRKEWADTVTQQQITQQIREKLRGYIGIAFNFSQPIQHELDDLVAGSGSQVVIRLFGSDMDLLNQKATLIRDSVLFQMDGAEDIFLEQVAGQKQLQIRLKRDVIAEHGITIHAVQDLIRNAIGGKKVGKVFEANRVTDINLIFDEPFRKDVEAYGNLTINAPGGYPVPLDELADIKLVLNGKRQISHENASRYVSVQCNVVGRDEARFVEELQDIVSKRIEPAMPPGYTITYGGQFELREQANNRLLIIVPITLFLLFIIIYGMFNSPRSTLIIFLNIPLSFVGGVVALALTGEYLSIPSSIGFAVLFGIAIEDDLVLVSRIRLLQEKGKKLKEAVLEGAISKLRPVLMTSVTTFLGLLPMIIASGPGAEIQRPLAIVVLGGLASSTILTLFVIPVMYEWFCKEEG